MCLETTLFCFGVDSIHFRKTTVKVPFFKTFSVFLKLKFLIFLLFSALKFQSDLFKKTFYESPKIKFQKNAAF